MPSPARNAGASLPTTGRRCGQRRSWPPAAFTSPHAERVVHTVDAASGEPTGRFDLGVVTQTELAVVDGVAYVGAAGALHAIDAGTGRGRWSSPLSDHDLTSGPTVAGGVIYVGAADGEMYAVDANTGEQRWHAGVGSLRSSPAIIGGVLYLGSNAGSLRAVVGSS